MARTALTGSRIRARRIDLGVKQAALAERCGISASYLNLIEHNRRRIGGKLLIDLAGALDLDPAALSQGADEALLEALRDAARGSPAEIARAEEFAGRFPGWAALVRSQARRIAAHEHTIEALSDRLAHDPFLSTSLHDVLSTVTAIRSASSILAGDDAVDPSWQARFHRNIHEDSQRLAEASRSLVAYLDAGADTSKSLASPQEDVDAWLERRGHYFAEVEDGSGDVETILADAPELQSGASRALARSFLAQYAEDARLMPEAAVRDAAARTGDDPSAMAVTLGAGYAAVFRRIAVLGFGDGPVGLAICDGSGALIFRKPIEAFPMPRFEAACPLWPLFTALGRPSAPFRSSVEVSGRAPMRFTTYSVAETTYPRGMSGPHVTRAHMLVLPGSGEETALGLGTSCRICARRDCPARREPSVLADPGDRDTAAF